MESSENIREVYQNNWHFTKQSQSTTLPLHHRPSKSLGYGAELYFVRSRKISSDWYNFNE